MSAHQTIYLMTNLSVHMLCTQKKILKGIKWNLLERPNKHTVKTNKNSEVKLSTVLFEREVILHISNYNDECEGLVVVEGTILDVLEGIHRIYNALAYNDASARYNHRPQLHHSPFLRSMAPCDWEKIYRRR